MLWVLKTTLYQGVFSLNTSLALSNTKFFAVGIVTMKLSSSKTMMVIQQIFTTESQLLKFGAKLNKFKNDCLDLKEEN